MAVRVGSAELPVVPVLAKNFSRNLATQMVGPAVKSSEKAGKEHGRRFGTSFSGGLRAGVGPVRTIFRGFGPGLAAAFGGAALVAGIKSVTDEAREAAVVGKQTAAVLKSTGGVANVSAKQVASLAESISNAVGVDDELIQSGENWLLTFKNVRDEAGKGNDVFTRASRSAVDLAASMHQGEVSASGLHSANTMLGKALNDPIKGMTALSRAGVTFNAQQQEQIRTLVKSGNTLGAQKIILAEVESQTKGFAAASADSGTRFGVFVANLKEQIGTVLLPALNRLLGFLVDKLPGALATVGGWFSKVRLGVKALGSAFSGEGVTSDGFVGVMEKIGVALRAVWSVITRFVIPAFRSIADSVQPAIKAFVSGLLPGLKSLWKVLVAQVFPAVKIVAAIIGVTLFAALKFVLPILLRIAGPVLGLLFKSMAQLINQTALVIRWIGRIGASLLRWITGTKTTGAALIKLGLVALKIFRAIFNSVSNVVIGILHVMGKLPGPMGAPFRKAEEAAKKAKQTVNTQMDKLQARVNKLKGKDIHVKAIAGVTVDAKTHKWLTIAQRMSPELTKRLSGAAHGMRVTAGTTATADDVLIRVSKGETVVPTRSSNKPEFKAWAASEGIPGFAGGGVAGMGRLTTWRSDVVKATTAVGGRVADALARSIGAGLSVGIRKAAAEGGGGSAAIKAFIKSTDPLPYVWAAAGPGSYDCSGLVSAVYGKMTGKGGGHGQRYFTTSSISATGGLKRGLGGVLQIGVTAGTGHMAGRYGGLGFEAESSRTGIKIGSAASRPESFARHFYMARGGRIDPALVALAAREGADVAGDPGNLRINGQSFDRGGTLSPGLNLLANRTGRPEPLVPAGGGIDYDRLAKAVARALRDAPPVVRVDDVHTGLKAKKRGSGYQKLGLD